MNKKKIILLLASVAVIASVLITSLHTVGVAKVDNNTKLQMRLKKPDIVDLVFVPYNNWSYVMRNTGSFMYDSPDRDGNGNNAGGEFPRGSGITIVFAAGAWLGTLKGAVPVVSETQFSTEFSPGRILDAVPAPFINLTAEDPSDAALQVYMIDRTYSGDDYANWPLDAPRDFLGLPGLIADGQTWCVFNDIDISNSQEGVVSSPSPGLGIQIILESFAFNAGPLSDVIYLKFTFDNHTNVDYANSYLGLWMDADVDNAANDLIGSDTIRGLGYVYNADATDHPECTGFDFFQGPKVSASSVSATLAAKNATNKVIKVYDAALQRYKNVTLTGDTITLGATTLNTYPNGGDPTNNAERYNLLKGLDNDGSVNVSGINGFLFPADPLGPASPYKNTIASDKRILHGVGPFTVNAGARQEIWAGVVGASVPVTAPNANLAAVTTMRATDDLAQATFDAGLVAPVPPAAPKMSLTASDKQVVITWQNNAENTPDLAGQILNIDLAHNYSDNYSKYDFQGYRVWRSLTGLPGTFNQLAQYDLVDGITTITNPIINSGGELEIQKISVGTDNGLKYSFTDVGLTNYQTYFYSVTAYDAQPYISKTDEDYTDPATGLTIPKPSGLPISLQSAQTANVQSAAPMTPSIQVDYAAALGSTTHAGGADATVKFQIIDKTKLTGATYKVQFFDLPTIGGKTLEGLNLGDIAYSVYKNNTLVKFDNKTDDPRTFYDGNGNHILDVDSTGAIIPASLDEIYDDSYFSQVTAIEDNDLSDEQFSMVDGILVKAYGPSDYFKSIKYVKGTQYTAANQDTAWFKGMVGEFTDQEAHDLGIGSAENSFIPHLTNFGGPPDGVGPPKNRRDMDIVFSRDSSKWQYSYATTGGSGALARLVRVPFQVLEVDPVDGGSSPRLLNIKTRERHTTSGANLRAFSLHNGAFTLDPEDDGTGPQVRGFWFVDSSTYTFTGTSAVANAGVPLFHFVNPAPAGGLTGINPYWASPTHVGFTPMPRRLVSTPSNNGRTWNDLMKTTLGAATSFNIKQQVDVYSAIPDEGTVQIRVNHPYTSSDSYTLTTTGNGVASKSAVKNTMDDIRVVPNPYYGRAVSYQATIFDKKVKFTHLPDNCTIKIFTVSGDLVRTIAHNNLSNNDRLNTNPLNLAGTPTGKNTSVEIWDLRTESGEFVASGMYVGLVESKGGFGKKLVKFAILQEKITINGPDAR